MRGLKESYKKNCKNIRLIITDVDGVLTDGGRYYSKSGEKLKKFHVRDGMGVNLLLRCDIKTVILTKERSEIVKKWSKDMNVSKIFMGINNKESLLLKICRIFDLRKEEIAFIGDDVNDIELMKKVGFSVTPNDGIKLAQQTAKYICKQEGGKCAFRELADLILSIKFPNKKNFYQS